MERRTITLTIKFPEGYEYVHEDLCIADLELHKDFKIIDTQEWRDLDFINRELKDTVEFFKAENKRMREALTRCICYFEGIIDIYEAQTTSYKSKSTIKDSREMRTICFKGIHGGGA